MSRASTSSGDAAVTSLGGARAIERCQLLSRQPYSDTPDALYRGYLTPAHAAARDQLAAWMGEAGMATSVDPAGNLIGRYPGTADGPALLIGSHIDSVRDAGAFDGPLGILLGVECVAALNARGERPPFPIEVIAFGDEEGSRFPAAMLTSRALASALDPKALEIRDAQGVWLADALADFGLDAASFAEARRPPGSVLAYLEAHIEQGPQLEAEGLPVGIVTAIAGQRRLAATFTGMAGHAGTSSMALRRDALTAAAEAVLAVEQVAREGRADLVATVGRLRVAPGATNVIPGLVKFSIDVRAGADEDRDAATVRIREALTAIAAARSVALELEEVHAISASPCDPALTELLVQAVAAAGLTPRRLVSGAGHDAMVMAALAPTAMLFIRCAGGISHNPLESATADDAERALEAMLLFIEGLAR